jgi:hypothetical protein
MTAIARGFLPWASMPADSAANEPAPKLLAQPSAICERQELPVHRKRIFIGDLDHGVSP